MQTEKIKAEIKKSYGNIAKSTNEAGCCTDTACCTNDNFALMTEDYSNVEGYHKEADLALGCGLPTEIAISMRAIRLLTLVRAQEMTFLLPEEL